MASGDLQTERTQNTIPFTDFLYTDDEKRLHLIAKDLVKNDAAFNQGIKVFDQTRAEMLNMGLQQNARLIELMNAGTLSVEDTGLLSSYQLFTIGHGLHQWMFVPCIEDLGTPEQVEQWAKPAKEGKIIGAYNQTEIGHGSDIQRLETTATYDPETQEFILHSPTVSSIKVWAGGLGFAATHCVAQCQVYTQGQHVGLHTFFVPVRDVNTREALPGIEVGEVGPKTGMIATDNGWLLFNNYRVPRENMLARLNEIQPDGTFVKKLESRIGYASMMRIRCGIVNDAGVKLSKAAVITTRYSVIRRQFPTKTGEERKVLDYQMQATRVLTQLANAYLFKIASTYITDFLKRTIKETEQGSFENLGTLHTELSWFKVFSSKIASEGIEILRQCCGGHGFSVWSGLPHLFGEMTARCTYEGDNHMLYMQTSKKLLKCMAFVFQGKQLQPQYQFIADSVTQIGTTTPETFFETDTLLSMLKSWTIAKLQQILAPGVPEQIAEEQVDMYEATFAYFLYRYASIFAEHLANADPSIKPTLQYIVSTFVLHNSLPYVGSLHALGVLQSPESYTHMRSALQTSLLEIRKSAVALTDAFDYTDDELLSALGCYDGDAYNRLFECYKGARLNQPEERGKIDGALKYLRPLAKL